MKVLADILESSDDYKIRLSAIRVLRECNKLVTFFLTRVMFWIGRNTKEAASEIFTFSQVREAQIKGGRNDGSEESRTGVWKLVYKDGI